jgi:glycine cleavage system protein P-like pyridoxal-binding family
MLKEAEDYAVRLLNRRGFDRKASEALARDLVKQYSTHEFVIDAEECKNLGIIRDDEGKELKRVGLHAKGPATPEIAGILETLHTALPTAVALGRVVPI